ncbi:hypothetical protein D9Q98_007167 [Chlorella vulgaris]|uniref:DUF599 domain-containing protein n=1 Tax=Chlorella vulgaris TaxID=3077 RepID=A0A9D4YUP4_CHLVU|nr:hypothetical protein D9Q98_007167 [Chlorella vulgaris]
MNSSQAADLAIFIICSVLFLAYNILLFNVSSFSLLGKRYVVLYAVNRQSRASWVQTLSKDAKEGINAVQTIRNQVLAVSILAATTAPMLATLINVMTDSAKLQQVAEFSKVDPISDSALLSPQLKLGVPFALLLLAVMAYAQSVRLSVHVGYTMRVVSSDPAKNTYLSQLSVTLMRRASLYFAVGLRLFFAFGPYILWVLGPTTLLIATVLDLAAQFLFDCIPASQLDGSADREEEEREAAAEAAARSADLVQLPADSKSAALA